MRMTITLEDSLLIEARALAARTGRTLDGDGLQPGVDLDASGDLLEIMEHSSDERGAGT
ncbi:MAG: hypothetical protein M3Q20_00590 [Actinomycetota bacterium]|nr:hypothetical protein [Actinomycetota bacterium]